MSDYSEKNIFDNHGFNFTVAACDCEVDHFHPSKGTIKRTFHLYPKDNKYDYAYMAGHGLVNRTNKNRAVMPELLAIKNGDVDAVEAFIKQYGFILPLNPDGYNSIDSEHIFTLINRLKATVALISALRERKINCEKIMSLTMYLLLSPQIGTGLPSKDNQIITSYHEMGDIWHNIRSVEKRNLETEDEAVHQGFNIDDTVRPPYTFVSTLEYIEMIDPDLNNADNLKSKIMYYFVHAKSSSYHCRLAIDFIYHFINEIGEIRAWNHDGYLVFAEDDPGAAAKIKNGLDNQLQAALLKLSKHTLKTEIDFNLNGIVPSYDTESMVPSWCIDYLLAGLYFSVFYMRSGEIYRSCAKCGRLFQISITSAKKKYCSDSCRNAMAQHNHRLRNIAREANASGDSRQ